MARKAVKQRPVIEELDGPTEAQIRNGDYERGTIIHADTFRRETVHINRGGTFIARWEKKHKLSKRQAAVIDWCLRLWHIAGHNQSVTAQYGERIRATGSTELAAIKRRAADEELTKFRSYVSRNAWETFENVCRFDRIGVADVSWASRIAEIRAHTLVCDVADMIAEKERM